ncbi:hypothetical protein G6F42_023409 [Rhizopus arrhizus]|nr:hypothetical protein G6F42_023409 [Rhizopus arrhizus]
MSPFHCSPEDAVDVHRDIKSKRSIAIHWGTFVLTDEPVQDPPQRLEAAMKQRGLNADDFGVLPLGGSFTTTAKSTIASHAKSMSSQSRENQEPDKEGPLLQSESPDPTLIQAIVLKPESDYHSQQWKNGLGTTDEIAIYPPDKDFTKDEFFWRFSTNTMHANCSFSLFPGYDCTTVILPTDEDKKSKAHFSLSHQGGESLTKIQPLFPYSWQGEWATTCKLSNSPVSCLQFMLRRELGKAQVRIEKIGSFETDLQGDVDSGKNMLFGAFALVYVVEGFISVILDENYTHNQKFELKKAFY